MAQQDSIRVAQITDECWRVESTEPSERGPYTVLLVGDDDGACECAAGRFEADCIHRATVRLAATGAYPLSRLEDISGPGADARMPEMIRQRIAAHNRQSRQRIAAATVTADDYELFG